MIHKSYFRPGQWSKINTNARYWTELKNPFNLLALLVVTDICMSLTVSKSHRFSVNRHFGFLEVLTGVTERCFPWIRSLFAAQLSRHLEYGTERRSGIARFSFPRSVWLAFGQCKDGGGGGRFKVKGRLPFSSFWANHKHAYRRTFNLTWVTFSLTEKIFRLNRVQIFILISVCDWILVIMGFMVLENGNIMICTNKVCSLQSLLSNCTSQSTNNA